MKVVAYIFVGFVGGMGNPCQNFIWKDLEGKPILLHIIDRLKMSRKITDIIPYSHLVKEEDDKKALELAERYGLKLYLLKTDRWENMLEFQNNIGIEEDDIVIFPINSPLIDPEFIDSCVEKFKTLGLDYMWTEDFPGGIGVELWKGDIWHKFCRIDPKGTFLRTGEHHSFAKTSDIFKTNFVKAEGIYNEPTLQLQLSSVRQLQVFRKIYNRFYKEGKTIDCKDVINLYEETPDWFEFLPGSQIEIEITNDCNLKCIMCPRTSEMSREIGCMHFDVFKKIIDETDASSIHFSGLGEPLLHPQIKEMFTYAKEKGLEVGLWTSGLELTEELSEQIIEREFVDYIIFGLDAATKETYAKIKGVDAFDKAVGNINRFLKLKKEKIGGMEKDTPNWWGNVKPVVGIQILKMKENDSEIEQFMAQWDFQDKLRKMLTWKQKMEEIAKELKPLEEELDRIKDRLDWKEPAKGEISEAKKPKEVIGAEAKLSAKSQELMEPLNELYWKTFYEKFLPVEYAIIGHFNNFCGQIEDRSAIDVTPLKRFPCKQLKSGISVLWNGDVVLCRQDFGGEHPLGNLKEKSLANILESQRLKDIWQLHKDGEYEKFLLCKNCKEWYYNLYA